MFGDGDGDGDGFLLVLRCTVVGRRGGDGDGLGMAWLGRELFSGDGRSVTC